MRQKALWIPLALAFTFALAPLAAQESDEAGETPKMASGAKHEGPAAAPKIEDKLVTTQHKAVIGGKEIHYSATAGTLILRDEDGKPRASIFFTYYARDGVTDKSKRPITYTYNGGPGSSSVWLHLGAFGPKRVKTDDEGMALPPPYELGDNAESLLDITDLVFIDPVTTGYSRAIPGTDAKKYYGVKEDAETMADFIRLWTGRFGRWSSPKFLAGESYGTTRSARLSNVLQSRHGIYLNGIVLLSSILNFGTARFDVGNDLPYPLFLPTYTAIAWYHKRLPADLQAAGVEKATAEARRFALGEYMTALAKGNGLTPDESKAVAGKVARYTGLSADYVERANLRVEIQHFVKELLRDQRLTVGRLDARFKGKDRDVTGATAESDPSYAAIQGTYTATFNEYASQALGYKSDLPYEILTDRVRPWSYNEFSNSYLNVAEDLRKAMVQNPALKVFVGNGYYDLATPFFATEYTFDHIGFEPDYRQRVSLHYYQAGHMMYIRRADREQLKKDIAAFMASAMGGS
ncbi:MAG TPA: peptidase S10 [Thermoanaerobaculia bacterium]|jgi:carboxypeptidase C (cathepsin A)|nr:peptidase S10 [Thermoanaerobaculia bacterium]